MFRKIALGLFAAVALTAASLAPAAAGGGGGFHGHGHWGHGGWGHNFYNTSSYYVGSNNCYEQVVVQTRRGARVRVVNTCGYAY